jgi:hypothetical protein
VPVPLEEPAPVVAWQKEPLLALLVQVQWQDMRPCDGECTAIPNHRLRQRNNNNLLLMNNARIHRKKSGEKLRKISGAEEGVLMVMMDLTPVTAETVTRTGFNKQSSSGFSR